MVYKLRINQYSIDCHLRLADMPLHFVLVYNLCLSVRGNTMQMRGIIYGRVLYKVLENGHFALLHGKLSNLSHTINLAY